MKKQESKITEIELIYHDKQSPTSRLKIKTSDDAYNALISTWDMNKIELQEQFRVLLVDRQNKCLGVSTLATGGISDCHVDLKLAFALALKAKASGIILAHNHPSGNANFSEDDRKLTKKFQQIGALLSIDVLDHILVTKHSHTSMSDKGLML